MKQNEFEDEDNLFKEDDFDYVKRLRRPGNK